jgi:hypothetical protein
MNFTNLERSRKKTVQVTFNEFVKIGATGYKACVNTSKRPPK